MRDAASAFRIARWHVCPNLCGPTQVAAKFALLGLLALFGSVRSPHLVHRLPNCYNPVSMPARLAKQCLRWHMRFIGAVK